MDEIDEMTPYTQELAQLARRAARLGMYIDVTWRDKHLPPDWPGHGPYVLRCAETDYDCHAAGVNFELLKEQLDQIERESDWCRCPRCDGITTRSWLDDPDPTDPDGEGEPVVKLVA